MKLIGAGLPRTATTTQIRALEGTGQWDEIFKGKESTVDFPASYFWRELMDVYPDAKVLLSVRSAESWVSSMQNTIAQIWFGDSLMHHLAQAQYQIDPVYAGWLDLLHDMWTEAGMMVGHNGDPERMAAEMEQWNQAVIDTVPAE